MTIVYKEIEARMYTTLKSCKMNQLKHCFPTPYEHDNYIVNIFTTIKYMNHVGNEEMGTFFYEQVDFSKNLKKGNLCYCQFVCSCKRNFLVIVILSSIHVCIMLKKEISKRPKPTCWNMCMSSSSKPNISGSYEKKTH